MFVSFIMEICQQWSGINAINFYSTQIFNELYPTSNDIPKIFTEIIGVIGMIAPFCAGVLLLDRFGRKAVTHIGQIILTIVLVFVGLVSKYN